MKRVNPICCTPCRAFRGKPSRNFPCPATRRFSARLSRVKASSGPTTSPKTPLWEERPVPRNAGRTSACLQLTVETVLGAGLWQAKVDPAQLESAVLNLCVNACDAMPDGGKLTIETSNAFVDDAFAREFAIEPGQYVLVAVADIGFAWMPPCPRCGRRKHSSTGLALRTAASYPPAAISRMCGRLTSAAASCAEFFHCHHQGLTRNDFRIIYDENRKSSLVTTDNWR